MKKAMWVGYELGLWLAGGLALVVPSPLPSRSRDLLARARFEGSLNGENLASCYKFKDVACSTITKVILLQRPSAIVTYRIGDLVDRTDSCKYGESTRLYRDV